MKAFPSPDALPATHYRVAVKSSGGSKSYVCCPHGLMRQTPANTRIILAELRDAEHFHKDLICGWLPLLAARYGVALLELEPVSILVPSPQ